MKTYRITYRHEVYIKAKDPKNLKDKWEGVNLGNLNCAQKEGQIESEGFVELISAEEDVTHKDVLSEL